MKTYCVSYDALETAGNVVNFFDQKTSRKAVNFSKWLKEQSWASNVTVWHDAPGGIKIEIK